MRVEVEAEDGAAVVKDWFDICAEGKRALRTNQRGSEVAGRRLYFASSGERGIGEVTQRFAEILGRSAPPGMRWRYEKMPDEKHSTIYHPAALKAFRAVFGPNASR